MVTTRVAWTVVEVLFVLAALTGVAMVSVPAALILGGGLGALACERADAARRAAAETTGDEQ